MCEIIFFLNLKFKNKFFMERNLSNPRPMTLMPPIVENNISNDVKTSINSCITLDSRESVHDCDSNCSCLSFITSTFLNEEYPQAKKLRLSPYKKEYFPPPILEPRMDSILNQEINN
jgi:hypothetical protein